MIPKYIVFNTSKTDGEYYLSVAQGNDFNELLSIFHGKAYQIMEVKKVSSI